MTGAAGRLGCPSAVDRAPAGGRCAGVRLGLSVPACSWAKTERTSPAASNVSLIALQPLDPWPRRSCCPDRSPTRPDPKPLRCPRFSSDPVPEACSPGEHRMLLNEDTLGVKRVQAVLIDLGRPVTPARGDGIFGPDTGRAVSADNVIKQLSPSHPVVGPGTMGSLDDDLYFDPRRRPGASSAEAVNVQASSAAMSWRTRRRMLAQRRSWMSCR
jgi:hypothetical protein